MTYKTIDIGKILQKIDKRMVCELSERVHQEHKFLMNYSHFINNIDKDMKDMLIKQT